jgi:hypothetical protein
LNERTPSLSIYRMAPSYYQLRRLHFRTTIKAWLRGIDKALLAFAGVLPIGILAVLAVFVLVQAEALRTLLRAEAPIEQRLAVVVAWQFVTFVLLRALREAVLMPKARAFFSSLPIPSSCELQSDFTFALQGYSLLWAPLGWVAYTSQTFQAWLSLGVLVVASLCANLALLRARPWHSLPALAALLTMALPPRPLILFGAAAVAGFALWRSYLPGSVRATQPTRVSELAERLSIRSGLALSFFAHDLRSNVLIRTGFIASTLAACLLMTALRAQGAAGTRSLVFVGAMATVALYPLPVLWRNTLLTRLHFLAGQADFVRRIRPSVYGIPALLFGGALLVAAFFDAGESAPATSAIFGALFVAGVVAARCGVQMASWLMPLSSFVAVLILGGIL